MFAVARASEICIGIIGAGVVLASTDFGGARHRLAAQLATISAQIVEGLTGTFENIPPELRYVPAQEQAADWTIDPSSGRKACAATVRTLTSLAADTPSLRLLADSAAEALIGVRRALDGLLLLIDPARNITGLRSGRFGVPDLLPGS
jgi:hypothetical protein